MDILIDTLFNTDWGIIILGVFLLGFVIIEFWNNKNPKI